MDPDLISAGVGAVGSLFKGIGAYTAGRAQKHALDAAADQTLAETSVQSSLALASGERAVAKGATQAAANGGGLGGSSMAVLSDLSAQALYQARAAVYGGVTQANDDRYNGEVAAANGRNQLLGSLFGAAGSLASSYMSKGYRQSFSNSSRTLAQGGG